MNLMRVMNPVRGWDVINPDTGEKYLEGVPVYQAEDYIQEAESHDPERCQCNYPPPGAMDTLSEE